MLISYPQHDTWVRIKGVLLLSTRGTFDWGILLLHLHSVGRNLATTPNTRSARRTHNRSRNESGSSPPTSQLCVSYCAPVTRTTCRRFSSRSPSESALQQHHIQASNATKVNIAPYHGCTMSSASTKTTKYRAYRHRGSCARCAQLQPRPHSLPPACRAVPQKENTCSNCQAGAQDANQHASKARLQIFKLIHKNATPHASATKPVHPSNTKHRPFPPHFEKLRQISTRAKAKGRSLARAVYRFTCRPRRPPRWYTCRCRRACAHGHCFRCQGLPLQQAPLLPLHQTPSCRPQPHPRLSSACWPCSSSCRALCP